MSIVESETEREVAALAQGFRAYWAARLGRSPRYRLDFSWPSVGIVELLLDDAYRQQAANNQQTSSEQEASTGHGSESAAPGEEPLATDTVTNLLIGASAYLGVIIATCWRRMPGEPTVSARFIRSPKPEVELEARGGDMLKAGESYRLNVTSALRIIFEDRPRPMPIWDDKTRDLPPRLVGLSAYVAGMCAGRSPLGEGAWLTRSTEEYQPTVEAVGIVLAQSSAEYHEANFPTDLVGSDPYLYAGGLILPPATIDEDGFCIRALEELIRHLTTAEIDGQPLTENARQAVVMNLATSPDETIALVASAVAVALCGNEPPPKLLAIVESLGPIRVLLLPLVAITRAMMAEPPTPLTLIDAGSYEAAARMLIAEGRLGLAPLIQLPQRLFSRKELHPLIELLYCGKTDDAASFLDELGQGATLEPALVLQRAFLALEQGATDEAWKLLERIRNNVLSDTELATSWFECAVRHHLLTRDFVGALDFAEAGSKTLGDPAVRARLEQISVDLLLASRQPSDAWDRAAEILERDPSALGPALSKIEIDLFYGGSDELEEELDRLIHLAPMHPRTIQAVLWADATKRQQEEQERSGSET